MKRSLAALLLALGLLAFPLLAAEEAEHKSAVPEVSVLWKWANFAILFGVLGYLVSKNVAPMLKKRSEDIVEGLAAGERAKAEAEANAKLVAAKLSNLGAEIEKMKAEAAASQEREAARLQRETELELERIARQAEIELESAAKIASLEVRRFAAVKALELAEAKVKAGLTPAVQAQLLENFVKKVATGSTGQPAAN